MRLFPMITSSTTNGMTMMACKDASQQQTPPTFYDVCIVGAGPAALACLSAISEPYALDSLSDDQVQRANKSLKSREPQSLCVLDPSNWMQGWNQNMHHLNIQYLRSPAMGHPDLFDPHALLAFGSTHRRGGFYESGCCELKELKGLQSETAVGLWNLPSSTLFSDFCNSLVQRLSHTKLTGHAVNVQSNSNQDGTYIIEWVDTAAAEGHEHEPPCRTLTCRHVILAVGSVGRPVVPRGLKHCPFSWWHSTTAFEVPKQGCSRVLVVGGGLTAVQVALKVVTDNESASCVLCSRRPLHEKHFDIPVRWFDRRCQNRQLYEFYHQTKQERLELLKKARDGGSVPPMYMRRLEKHQDRLVQWIGDVEYVGDNEETNNGDSCAVTICFEGIQYQFDKVILACGMQPDCTTHSLMQRMIQQDPSLPTYCGFPDVSQDLRWGRGSIFVAGAMAGLQVGPDAANLMGMRRAATVIANSLECRCWLRESAVSNAFEVLLSDSDTESESESIRDCPTCCSENENCFIQKESFESDDDESY